MKRTIWLLLLALPAAPSFAADGPKPGLWEYTTKTEIPGMPFPMPPVKFQRCMTQEDSDKANFSQKPDDKNDCEISNLKRKSDGVSYDVTCKGKHPASGHYDFTYSNTARNGNSISNVDFKRDTSCVASNEWPPNSKKLAFTLTCSSFKT